MSSWFDRQLSNHNVQLAAVAAVTAVTVAGAIYGTQAIRQKEKMEELKASIPALSDDNKAALVTIHHRFCLVSTSSDRISEAQ